MTDAAVGWVVILALVAVPVVWVTVVSRLKKRDIWAAGKDNDRRGGGGGGGCGGEAVAVAEVIDAPVAPVRS
jgi:hypothetical protein